MLTDVRAGLGGVLLEVAVDRIVHARHENAVDVGCEQRVPLATPHHLDHVPARAAVGHLQLLDDLPAAAHRTVKALQVAVDNEDQIVELLACGNREAGLGFGFVHLAVAREAPHLRAARVHDLVVQEVAVDAGLRDGVQRTETHRDCWELPELGHPPRMRIRGQAVAADLAPEAVELILGESTLEERTGVDPRRGVTLDEDLVAVSAVVLALEEVVEAHFVERRSTRISGEMAAETVVPVVGAIHHRHCVPADVGTDAALDVLVAGKPRLGLWRNRVHVRSGNCGRKSDGAIACMFEEPHQEVPRP